MPKNTIFSKNIYLCPPRINTSDVDLHLPRTQVLRCYSQRTSYLWCISHSTLNQLRSCNRSIVFCSCPSFLSYTTFNKSSNTHVLPCFGFFFIFLEAFVCVIVPLRKKSRKTTIFIKILTHGLKINTFVFAKID